MTAPVLPVTALRMAQAVGEGAPPTLPDRGGPPWCSGSTQAFGALRPGFEPWGRSGPADGAGSDDPGAATAS